MATCTLIAIIAARLLRFSVAALRTTKLSANRSVVKASSSDRSLMRVKMTRISTIEMIAMRAQQMMPVQQTMMIWWMTMR